MPIYLKLDGIQGNATQENHKQWMDIKSVSWGVTRSMNTLAGSTANREGSEPNVSEVTLTKTSDSSTPKLMQAATTGNSGKTATIDFVTTGNVGTTYLSMTLTNVLVSGYSLSSEGDRPDEHITLNFTKIELNYTGKDDSHADQGAARASYDSSTTKSS